MPALGGGGGGGGGWSGGGPYRQEEEEVELWVDSYVLGRLASAYWSGVGVTRWRGARWMGAELTCSPAAPFANVHGLVVGWSGKGCQTLRTALHAINLCLQNSFIESNSQWLVRRKAPREFLPSSLCPVIPSLMMKGQMVTRNTITEKNALEKKSYINFIALM